MEQRIGCKKELEKGYKLRWIKVVIMFILSQTTTMESCALNTEFISGASTPAGETTNSSVSGSLIQV